MSNESTETKRKVKNGSFRSIFMHADGVDMFLMTLGFLGAVGDGFSVPLMLLVMSKMMNNIGSSASLSMDVFIDKMNKNAAILCYMAIGICVACFLEGYCWARTAERQASKLRSTYLKAVLRQEVAYFDLNTTSTSDIVTSVSSDSLLIQEVISEKVPVLVMNVAVFGGAYFVGFILLWRLAVVALPFILILVTPGLICGRVLMSLSRKIREEYNKAGSVAEQAISSVRTVYSFVGENKAITEFSAALEGTLKMGLKQGLAKGVTIGSNGLAFCVWSFMAWYGSRLVMYHGARGGTVFAVSSVVALGGLSLGSGLSNVKFISDAMAASERIKEVIERVPAIDSDDMAGETLQQVSGEVEFKNVKFAYPSRPESLIFKDFNLKIPAGRTVALVGGSGSGKSTVIALLQRFYNPHGGEICMDGKRIDKLQLKWLRSQMGLVSQEPALFATTIKENILFGKEDAAMDEVIEAAKASNAHNFISQLPLAYDTQVGERGVQMSGGQKQRIAIARAIIKSPHILLLDEATSALDSESERVVQEALDQASVGRTTIVVAHRLTTIRNADVIAVVNNGQVVESGSHNELIQLENGFYTSLVRLQETKPHDEPTNHFPLGPSSAFDVHNTSSRRHSIVSRSSSINSVNHGENPNLANEEFPVPSIKRLLAMNAPEWKEALFGSVGAVLFGAVQPVYRDIKSYHLRTLRKYFALVSQEPTLFAGTIHENIIYGASEEVSESEIIEAAKAANAHDFIAVLKDGYDTWCGDRGVQLSGGQKQRIAIARAILKNPAILLLDEATSALDSQSEKVVQDALERMLVGRTSVVVAHRLSTIQSCDTIAVLEKGKVVEKGNHGSLLAKGPTGAYYALVRVQKPNSG
ncbi:ABC transporter B family member 15-like [Cynara cardunculus var. scolymus]|uniref:ABC transporter B family member 15-like n=1 Tax=Cynara cardunculus var. scolymus TaxID=59895 RepID=UPI000D623344|nr:ABC transporter B family member 15-like [Cynara cardunculus var. scolymus]